MSVLTDRAKSVMLGLSGKNLTNAVMLRVATRYARRNGYSNPWDEEVNPTEYAAWPTVDELAEYFLNRVRNQVRADLGGAAGREFDEDNESARNTVMVEAQVDL